MSTDLASFSIFSSVHNLGWQSKKLQMPGAQTPEEAYLLSVKKGRVEGRKSLWDGNPALSQEAASASGS
jgi:hypothetical protein